MNLFQLGRFILSAGEESMYKIDCDALAGADWECLAYLLSKRLPPFATVEGVPRGGLKLAEAMRPFRTWGAHLIVDDVYTTGGSLGRVKNAYASLWPDRGTKVLGAVVFARSRTPEWVTPLFPLTPERA